MREHVLSSDFEPAKNAADGAIIGAADHVVPFDGDAALLTAVAGCGKLLRARSRLYQTQILQVLSRISKY